MYQKKIVSFDSGYLSLYVHPSPKTFRYLDIQNSSYPFLYKINTKTLNSNLRQSSFKVNVIDVHPNSLLLVEIWTIEK